MKPEQIDLILKAIQALTIIAPEAASAVIALTQAPALSKADLLAAAADLDSQTIAFLEAELSN